MSNSRSRRRRPVPAGPARGRRSRVPNKPKHPNQKSTPQTVNHPHNTTQRNKQYAANDGPDRFDEVKPKVYERLVRKILQKPRRPAVVLLQLMPKGMAYAPGQRDKAAFPATLEDVYGSLAQYYDTPWLSFRNAAWRLGEFGQLSPLLLVFRGPFLFGSGFCSRQEG